MKTTITALLDHAVAEFGSAVYLNEKTDAGWRGTSFAETRLACRAIAAAFIDKDLVGTISIIAEGRSSWIITELAALSLGQISVPLSIKLQADEIPYRINHAEVKLIVCSSLSLEKVLAVWPAYDHPVSLLYLDNDPAALDKIQAATGLLPGKSLFVFEELLAYGRELAAKPAMAAELDARQAKVEPLTPATISYTSGTTGNPKGITLSHKNYWHNVVASTTTHHIASGTRMFVVLPIDHAYAHTISVYAPILVNMSIVFVDARGGAVGIARNILPNMEETHPLMMLTVPSLTATFMGKIVSGVKAKGKFIYWLFERGLSARICMNGTVWKRPPWYRRILPWFPYIIAETLIFKKVRQMFGPQFSYTISGGAMLEIKQQEFFKALGITVFQGYGLSEASPVVSTNTWGAHKIGSSGRLVADLQCRVVDERGQEVPRGTKGQITLKGETIMLGYYKNPEATAEAIRDGWLHTGDLGYMDEDGFLFVVGREKALLIMEDGEKYSPEEIEEAIIACSKGRITQCMLYCDHKRYVSAIIVVNPEEFRALTKGLSAAEAAAKAVAALQADFEAYRKDPKYADKFPKHWQPKTFALIEEPFSEANGMINSTMKMVRRHIVSRYQPVIDWLYSDEGAKPDNARNRETMSKLL
jgi:long-chain acyl-CoA synthetase